MVFLVFYHANCNDGFASAWVFSKKHPNAELVSVPAGKPIPVSKCTDRSVYCLDICPTNLAEIKAVAKDIYVIDHHKTNAEVLNATLAPQHYTFDMAHSACYLTWAHFFNEPVPRMIEYIQDRDLWTNKLDNCEAVSAYLTLVPHTIEAYDNLDLDTAISLGATVLVAYKVLQEKIAANVVKIEFVLNGKVYKVGYLNSPIFQSDLGNLLMTKHPDIDFAAIYWTPGTETYFSLRSTSEKADVSEIARHFGGGGHRNASGCTVKGVVSILPFPTVSWKWLVQQEWVPKHQLVMAAVPLVALAWVFYNK